jgi:hypothetical protein
MQPKTYNSNVNPYIVHVFEACTSHISEQDEANLKRDSNDTAHNPSLIIYPFEYGYFVFSDLPADEVEDIHRSLLEKEGYSKEFIQLLKLARQNGCKFLQLDGDGIEYEDLPTFTRIDLDPLVLRALDEEDSK